MGRVASKSMAKGEENRETSTYEETLIKAFEGAKRRKEEASGGGNQEGNKEGEKREWSSKDLGTFNEDVSQAKGNLGDDFLVAVQKEIPHAMYSEIIYQRRMALIEGRGAREDTDRRKDGYGRIQSTSETARNEGSGSKDTNDSSEEENRAGKFGVLTAKARRDFARDCKQQGRNKIRLFKKQAKERWVSAAAAASSLPRTHYQGDECTFDFDTPEHPWAKIHESHQAWFADLVAYCRVCGAVNSKKKGTLQKQCGGRPVRMENKSEPNGLKVIRLMGQGSPPPGDENVAQDRRQTAT